MKIAVAVTAGFAKTAGHAGRARKWLVFPVVDDGTLGQPERVDIPAAMVFHHFDGSHPHPLDGIGVLISLSAGDGFLAKMRKRGVTVALTSEPGPAAAAAAYLAQTLPPPKPRPVGALICKTIDKLTRPHRG